MVNNIRITKNNNKQPSSSQENRSILPLWFVIFCKPSRMIWLGPLIGLILTLPSLFMGYVADDHLYHQNVIEHSVYKQRPVWDYFNFVSADTEVIHYREKGILPWWTPETFRSRTFRPIASIIHTVLFRYFYDFPWIGHAGLILLYVLIIVTCTHLFSRFSSTSVGIGLAIFLFTINDTHAYSAGWLSSYNTMLSCFFGLLSLFMHDQWRRYKSSSAFILSILLFLLALLSSEGSLALIGYLLAYTLFIEDGSLKRKWVSLFPVLSISIVYLFLYSLFHFGFKNSGIYLSLSEDLIGNAFIILKNSVFLVFSEIISLPPLTMVLGGAGVKNGTAAIIAFLILVFLYLFKNKLLKNRTAAFYGIGMVLSIIPFALAGWMDRLLLWSGFGAAGFLGELFTANFDKNEKVRRFILRFILVFNTVFSILFFIPTLFFFQLLEKPIHSIEQVVSEKNTILINTPLSLLQLYPASIRYENGGKWPDHFYYLYAGEDTLRIIRTSERTLQVTVSRGWFATQGEQFFRAKHLRFKQGDMIKNGLMNVTIKKITQDGRPKIVDFTFSDSISNFKWLKWNKDKPEKWEFPEIGREITLVAKMY